ncbi:MAG: prephenate dehydrogenase/arogenate dehydrogenase family protein [Coriobacteriales bacterium]|jgi:prephenate dehydrogenase
MSVPFEKIAIVGVGLIGGSIAAALKSLDEAPVVYGIGPHEEGLEAALDTGALDEYALSDDPKVDEWLAPGGCDLVIIATPVFAARSWFERLERNGYEGAITDVASTKKVICSIADEVLTDKSRYLPGHPMAGSEASGFSAARADLFQGAYWILCPDDDTRDDLFLKLHETFTALGARIISIDREEHDSAVAIISHVPHMVASALVRLWGEHARQRKELLRLAASGFKDTTRVAAGSSRLWCGIALDNHEALAKGLHELGEIIKQFEDAIRDQDEARLSELLEYSANLRRSLPATWLPDSTKLTRVRIHMSNRPGIIAEVTGIAGHAGCNIQSIDIDHINEDTAVLELILTDEGDMGRLGGELINAGFDFSFRKLTEEE